MINRPKGRGTGTPRKPGVPLRLVIFNIRLTDAESYKLKALGGRAWLRQQLSQADLLAQLPPWSNAE